MIARVRPASAATGMLTEIVDALDVTAAHRLLSGGEASEFRALRDTLPEGWVLEFRPDAAMAWIAFVYQADAPRSTPMFTVFRWDDRVGLFTQWLDGSASSALVFTELWPILDLILHSIFTFMQINLVTVPAGNGTHTQH